jgi:hypothetical protein
MSSIDLWGSATEGCKVLYWPAGVNNKLPSGANVRRLKKDVNVSFAYIGAFLTPIVPMLPMLGELGMTAGRGMEGAGDADRRIDGDDPNDERRLCEVGGGFIGKAKDCGVPGADGTGDPAARADSRATNDARPPKSGGAGLFEDTRRAGRSILVTLLCCASENWPSFVLSVYMCTERSDDCVATYSFSGSHATPWT